MRALPVSGRHLELPTGASGGSGRGQSRQTADSSQWYEARSLVVDLAVVYLRAVTMCTVEVLLSGRVHQSTGLGEQHRAL